MAIDKLSCEEIDRRLEQLDVWPLRRRPTPWHSPAWPRPFDS